MAFDIIPIKLYTPIYYHIIMLVTLVTFLHTQTRDITDIENRRYIKSMGITLLLFVLLYMGLRPIHGVFVDLTTYNNMFLAYADGLKIISKTDIIFNLFMKFSSQIMSAQLFFFVCTVLYVVPLYLVSKKWFDKYWFYAFLMLVVSFSFWSYGTNGIRNGIATSMFLLAITRDKRIYQIVILIIAIGFHKTMLLPTAGFIATQFYDKPKAFLYFWLASIPLSLALPGFWENLFAGMIDDERMSYLTTEASTSDFSSVGFRWDFLIYSASGVFAGWYYIFKKKLSDKTYLTLFNIYLFANAFWILVIRANFSNRFAYLSWFMLALIIVYPWAKYIFTSNQHKKLGWLILAYFGFTYIMAIVL